MSLLKARSEAYRLANSPQSITREPHSKYSPIYLASTSNVKDTLALYHDYKKVLTLGATGAHAFEAALNGAEKIDMFDINELQKIYYELIKTAIIHLDYDDFIKYFTSQETTQPSYTSNCQRFFSQELYQKLKLFLPARVKFILGPLFQSSSYSNLLSSNLCKYMYPVDLAYLKKFISFYNEKEYNRLRYILSSRKCKINYHNVDITKVPTYFKDKYDLILLDNVLQYYEDIPELNTPSAVDAFIQKQLMKMLNNGGSIQASYGFEAETEAFQRRINSYSQNSQTYERYYEILQRQRLIDIATKYDINNLLYQENNNYEYSFFEGVESDKIKKENMVLTLRKK